MAGIEFESGRYWCRVEEQFLGESSNGNPQFILKFGVVGKINPADQQGELLECPRGKGRSIYKAITKATIDWFKRDLKYLCEQGKLSTKFRGFEYLDPNQPGYTDFTNTEFEAYCDHETYQGKTREKWNIASGGADVKPIEEKNLRKLNAMFGKELASIGGVEAPAPVAEPTPATSRGRQQKQPETVPPYLNEKEAVPPDDIPFSWLLLIGSSALAFASSSFMV